MKKLYNEFKPDIVIAHMVGSYGYVASKIHKGKIIMVAWGPDILITPFKSPIHHKFMRAVLKKATQIIVDSRGMKEVLIELGILEEKVKVFPYGPQERWLIFPKRTSISKPLKIVSHRKLEPEYDPFTIIEALKILNESGIDFYFVFASFGSLQKQIIKKINQLNLANRVKVTGFISEYTLLKTLRASHIYITASLYDSTSVSLLEAMALGLYPIASDVPANSEWITHGENGLIFEKGNAISLSESIIRVLRMQKSDYVSAIEHNYETLKRIGSFRKNVLKTVESVI